CHHLCASLSIYSFFFYCYLPLRDLHSFPTRRSSDLRAKNAAHVMATNFMIYGLGMLGFWICGFAFMFGNYANGPVNIGWQPNMKDRKSTRLNSSHRTISYAVFCLKKKKKKHKLQQLT